MRVPVCVCAACVQASDASGDTWHVPPSFASGLMHAQAWGGQLHGTLQLNWNAVMTSSATPIAAGAFEALHLLLSDLVSSLQRGFACATAAAETASSDGLYVLQQLAPLLGLRALPFKLSTRPPRQATVAPEHRRLFLSARDLRRQLFDALLEGIRSGATRDIRKLAAELLGHNCDATQLQLLLNGPLDAAAAAFREQRGSRCPGSPPAGLLTQTKGVLYSICTFATAGIRDVVDNAAPSVPPQSSTDNNAPERGGGCCPEQRIFLLFCKVWWLLEALVTFLSTASEALAAEPAPHEQMKCACVDSLAALLAVATATALRRCEDSSGAIALDCADAAMDCLAFCILEELASERGLEGPTAVLPQSRSPALWQNMLERCGLSARNRGPAEEGCGGSAVVGTHPQTKCVSVSASNGANGLGSAASNVLSTLSRVLGGVPGSSRAASKPEGDDRARELREFAAARTVEFLRLPLALLLDHPRPSESEPQSLEYFHTSCAALLQAAVVAVASAGRLRAAASGPAESVHHTLLRVATSALQEAAYVVRSRLQLTSRTTEGAVGEQHRGGGSGGGGELLLPPSLQPTASMSHQAIKLAFAVVADAVRQRVSLGQSPLKAIFDALMLPGVHKLCSSRAEMVQIARSLAQLLEPLIALPDT